MPTDAAVFQANRRHEDHHLADHQSAFDDTVGAWDRLLYRLGDLLVYAPLKALILPWVAWALEAPTIRTGPK